MIIIFMMMSYILTRILTRALTPRTPATAPIIIEPPSRASTQGKGIKKLSPNNDAKIAYTTCTSESW